MFLTKISSIVFFSKKLNKLEFNFLENLLVIDIFLRNRNICMFEPLHISINVGLQA